MSRTRISLARRAGHSRRDAQRKVCLYANRYRREQPKRKEGLAFARMA